MNKRNVEVDRLRAIAIILIAYCHFGRLYFPSIIRLNMQYGTALVEIFFVISGYVISTIVVQKIDQFKSVSSELAVNIKAFYIRRICRVYPAAWIVFLFVLISSYYFNSGEAFSTPINTIEAGVYLATSTFNYFFVDHYHSLALAPYWTLAIEEQFYFLFPLFILLTRNNRQRIFILIGTLLAITFIVRPLTMHYYPIQGFFFSQTRCDGLIYGCLIYHLTQQPWLDAIKLPLRGNKFLRCTFVVLLVTLLVALTAIDISTNVIIPLGAILASILVILASFEREIIVFPLLLQKWLDIIGVRSYSLYLIHMPIFLLAKELWNESSQLSSSLPINNSLFALCLLILATEILYRLVEKPTLQMSRRISKKINDDYQENKNKILPNEILFSDET
jgi:peptidoglycan/LPS O-acetylase OafA/YrhL